MGVSVGSAPPKNEKTRHKGGFCHFGALGRIRTFDRSVRSRVLYPAELRVQNLKGRIVRYLPVQVNFNGLISSNFNDFFRHAGIMARLCQIPVKTTTLRMLLQDIQTDQLSLDRLEIRAGECWAVLARNGSGKQMLTGVITGDTLLRHGSVSHDFANIGVLSFESQQALYEAELKLDDSDFMDRIDPGSTVRELLGLHKGIPDTLAFLGLEKILDRGYRLLSSGEGRKALLARIILQEPDFLILDEPYDSLDLQTRAELQSFFAGLLAEGKCSCCSSSTRLMS